MADVTITPANVAVESGNTTIKSVQFGEITANGDVVYRKASDGKYWIADNNVDVETARVRGIVLQSGAADAFGLIVTAGLLDVGGTLVKGTPYVLSANVGKIAPAADLVATNYMSHLGYAHAVDSLMISISNQGIVM